MMSGLRQRSSKLRLVGHPIPSLISPPQQKSCVRNINFSEDFGEQLSTDFNGLDFPVSELPKRDYSEISHFRLGIKKWLRMRSNITLTLVTCRVVSAF
jgi:hypothetical protein